MSDLQKKLYFSDFAGMVFFRFLLISVFSFLLSVPGRAEDRSLDKNLRNPEDSSLLYVYGGYGQYNWKMMSMGSVTDIFASDLPSEGMRFDHKATPFIVKKYGVKTNFLIFSLGLDYLGDTLELPTEFDNEKDLDESEGKRVKQLKYLSGLGYNDVSFHFNITRRAFNSRITSRGYRTYSGAILPIYYYTEDSEKVSLNDGDRIEWYTTHTEYEGFVLFNLRYSTMEFGVKYITFNAPTEIRIGTNTGSGDILMYTENKMVSLFAAADGLTHIAGDFYIRYYVPFNISGYYYAENDYFEVENKRPFSKNTFSQTVSSSGNFSIAYILKHMTLEAGVDYGLYFSYLKMMDVELKKDVEFYDTIYDSPAIVQVGEKADIDAERLEFIWGYYIKASAYF